MPRVKAILNENLEKDAEWEKVKKHIPTVVHSHAGEKQVATCTGRKEWVPQNRCISEIKPNSEGREAKGYTLVTLLTIAGKKIRVEFDPERRVALAEIVE